MDLDDNHFEVLIIEDDPAQIKVMRALLQHSKDALYLVKHAATLEAAKKQLTDETLDVVLLDLNLSDSRGIDTFETVIAERPDLPIIILSGMSDEDLAIDVVKRGAQDYLVKGKEDATSIRRSIKFGIERKKIQEEKKQLQALLAQESRLEALGVLASGVAHEINTPLQFIGANTSFLKKAFECVSEIIDKIDDVKRAGHDQAAWNNSIDELEEAIDKSKYDYVREQVSEAIEETVHGVARVHSIVSAMNVFARRNTRKLVRYDINSALNDALILSRNEWKYIAEAKTDFNSNIPPIVCCPEELCQVFLNLIINAAHAIRDSEHRESTTKRKGIIEITSRERCDPDGVEIWISDTGCGIPEDIQHRIFEPFFTTKEVGSGSGQGLAIARAIIMDKHNGILSFESDPETGTVFKVELPLVQPKESGANEKTNTVSVAE